MTPRDAILIILGMPRSGASLLMQSLETIGFTLPDDAANPSADSMTGPFEPQSVLRLNDQLLAGEGAWWARIGPLSVQPDHSAMQHALTNSFGTARRIAIKDPRLSLLTPAWRPVLEQMGQLGALIALRHPGETATSLARRNGIGVDAAYLMWIHYLLTALEGTEGLARGLILFPDWINDIDTTLARVADISGAQIPPDTADAIMTRFQPDAIHGGQQLRAADPETDLLAGDLFALAARHARNGSVPDKAEIAPFRARFDALATAARDIEAMAAIRISDLQDQVDRATARADRLADEAEAAARANAALQAEIQRLRSDADPHSAGPAPAHKLTPERHSPAKPGTNEAAPPKGAPGLIRSALGRLFGPGQPVEPPRPAKAKTVATPRGGNRSDFFIFSTEVWSDRPGRSQHLAAQLANAGHRIFFVEPVAGDGIAQTVAPGIHLMRFPGITGRADDMTDAPSPDMQRAWVEHFYQLADREDVTLRAHIVITHPIWWTLVRHLSAQFQITVDCDAVTPDAQSGDRAAVDLQQQMLAGADRIIVASQARYDSLSGQRRVRLIRNGADIDHFMPENGHEAPGHWHDPRPEGIIRVGYAGAVSDRLDMVLLAAVARQNPDLDIHLCGPASVQMAMELPNLSLHGAVPYADLPQFMAAMDVMILPYRSSDEMDASDPVAFYDHAAAGKLTVATDLPELARLGDMVTIASDPVGFAQGIRTAARKADNPMTVAGLRAFALENAWSFRAARLIDETAREPLLSVVIPTSGPAAATLACLHMLTGRGEVYPALEILLADFGSDPAALEDLRGAMERDPRIRLLTAGQGLDPAGAAANGIKAARGEFILLLDHRSLVPAGALSAMVRHLQRNPQIGIVGPRYDLADHHAAATDPRRTERTARATVTGHRGQWTPFPVDTAFCAMFRNADLDRAGLAPLFTAAPLPDGLETALAEDSYVNRARVPTGSGEAPVAPPHRRPMPSLPDSPGPAGRAAPEPRPQGALKQD